MEAEPEEILDERGLTTMMKWKTTGTARTLRHRGGGPPFRRLGRKVRYLRSEVLAWVASRPAFRSTTEADEHARKAG